MQLDFRHEPEGVVVAHARRLIGRTLRELYGDSPDQRSGKGAFGQLVEQLHFGYAPNSDVSRDLETAALELKATGVVPSGTSRWRAKERLVLNIIDYMALPGETAYRGSAFFMKNARILLVVYEWAVNHGPLDHRVNLVHVLDLDTLPPKDQMVIEDDWFTIRRFVAQGRAHELSEGHTNYLVAARKGAGRGRDLRSQPCSVEPAQQRAYSLKATFISRLLVDAYDTQARQRLEASQAPLLRDDDVEAGRSIEEAVSSRMARFVGHSDVAIQESIAPDLNRRAKGYHATLVRRMLGVTTHAVEEFEKADVTLKVVRVQPNGRPRESVSFPAFRYQDLARQTWRTSALRTQLSRRFLFAFFMYRDGVLHFERASFWTMPVRTLEFEARRVWVETVRRVRTGRANALPDSSFSDTVHVRPHARNSMDTDVTPQGQQVVKKSFWLNASYVGEVFQATATTKEH